MHKLINTDIIQSQPEILHDHLSQCIDFVLSKMEGVVSILLTGGYGRGEGSWINQNGAYRTYNDYDFIVILDREKNKVKEDINTSELAKSLRINWIDIDIFFLDEISSLKPTIKNFDILNGSCVIYGESKILESAPNIKSCNLTSNEFFTFYFTRAYTLLFCLPNNKTITTLTQEERIFFHNQLAKGFLAIMDCELLHKYSFYNSSYKKRLDFYLANSNNDKKNKVFKWALNEKLNPRLEEYDMNFSEDLLKNLLFLYQTDMNKYLGVYLNNKNLNPSNISKSLFFKPEILLKFLASFAFKRFKYLRKNIYLYIIQYVLIMTWPNSNSNYIWKTNSINSKKYISYLGYSTTSSPSWKQVKEIVKDSR